MIIFSSSSLATLRNKRKFAAITKVNHEDHPTNIQARNKKSSRIQEAFITQVSEVIAGRGAKNVSGVQQDENLHFVCLIKNRRIVSEPTSPGLLWNRSGDIPEFKQRKSGNE